MEKTIDDCISSCGYDLNGSRLEQALKCINPDPDFDIRLVAGIYKFTPPESPTTWLMAIHSGTGRYGITSTFCVGLRAW
jgi:hypothetical protein